MAPPSGLNTAAAARTILAARLAELSARAAHIRAALDEPVSADSEEAASEKQDDEALAGEEALIARESAEIITALTRIDRGDWGSCARCGQDINPRRLAVRPESALCITCASA